MRIDPLDEPVIELSCSHCRRPTNETLRWLKLSDEFHCPHCDRITMLDKDDLFCGFRRREDARANVYARISRFAFVE